MYNGLGLPTTRGSGTSGYVQSNKFSMKPTTRTTIGAGEGSGGISKKPNEEILEHERKRRVHVKLVALEEELTDRGYTEAEIVEKIEEARKVLEAEEKGGGGGEMGGSSTETHQLAARKEKQMERFRAALGIPEK